MSTAATTPTLVSPLQAIIEELQSIIEVQTANPTDPALESMLIEVQTNLAQAVSSIIGGGDDTNKRG